MKHVWIWGTAVLISLCAGLTQVASQNLPTGPPQYTKNNQLLRPDGYREWIYLSSGLGMNYSASSGGHEMFTNVFVLPSAYQEFMVSGKWPAKTVFVVEERSASSKGSINRTGHFQTDLMGLGVEVKDESRFPEKWAYFSFDSDTRTAKANPKPACWQCHNDHAAVENTFVQFYPTLKPIARKFGTYRKEAEEAATDQPSPRK